MSFLNSVRKAPGVRSAVAGAVVVCLGCWVGAVHADQTLEQVVVSATRTQKAVSQVLADVTVISREDIERQGAGDLALLLSRQSGLEIDRNGGPGSTTGVFIRGADSRFTAVLIDGVRVDSQSTGGAPWSAIPLAIIDRIEIVRGPLSAVYGSDAVSGVIQIFTRKGQGKPVMTLGIGAGSFGTSKASAALVGSEGALDYAWSVNTERSHGFNAIALPSSSYFVADDDGYRSLNGNLRLGWQINADHRVEAYAVSSRMQAQFDDGVPDVNDVGTSHIETLSTLWSARWTQAWRSQLQLAQSKEHYSLTPGFYDTGTRLRTMSWQNDLSLGAHGLHATLERREDAMSNQGTYTPLFSGQRSQNGMALGYDWKGEQWSAQLNARSDDDSEFGEHTTGALAASWHWAPAWRLSASAGTSFRAPTLYQRFSAYGNARLKAEEGTNEELSVKYREGAQSLGVTAFHQRIDNLIGFSARRYNNVSQARLQGLSITGETALPASWRLSGSLDLQSAINLSTGNWLLRRAAQRLSVQLDGAVQGWDLGLQMVASGSRHDQSFDASYNTVKVRLAPYVAFDVSAQRELVPGVKLLLKVDNLFDRDYQTATDFRLNPRALFVGLNWTVGQP